MATISKKQIGVDSRRKTSSGRFYDIVPEEQYISITNALESIAKPALYAWSAKVEREACVDAAVTLHSDWENLKASGAAEYRQILLERIGKQKASTKLASAAADIGTGTHNLVEWWAKTRIGLDAGKRPEVSEKSEWGFMAFEDWAKAHEFTPIRSEMVVFSHAFKIAGTLDLLGYIDGNLKLVDIKTGKAVYGEAKLQCAAYYVCLKEMGSKDGMSQLIHDSAIILRLPKVDTDPEFEAVPVELLDGHFQAFLHAKELRLWQIAEEKEYRDKLESLKGEL